MPTELVARHFPLFFSALSRNYCITIAQLLRDFCVTPFTPTPIPLLRPIDTKHINIFRLPSWDTCLREEQHPCQGVIGKNGRIYCAMQQKRPVCLKDDLSLSQRQIWLVPDTIAPTMFMFTGFLAACPRGVARFVGAQHVAHRTTRVLSGPSARYPPYRAISCQDSIVEGGIAPGSPCFHVVSAQYR